MRICAAGGACSRRSGAEVEAGHHSIPAECPPQVWCCLQIRDLKQLLKDTESGAEGSEMIEMIQGDLEQAQQRISELQQEVVGQLLSQDAAHLDSRNAILEVRYTASIINPFSYTRARLIPTLSPY